MQKAKSETESGDWGWILGERVASPLPHQLGHLGGSAVSSPSGVWGGDPEDLDFGVSWVLRNRVRTLIA